MAKWRTIAALNGLGKWIALFLWGGRVCLFHGRALTIYLSSSSSSYYYYYYYYRFVVLIGEAMARVAGL